MDMAGIFKEKTNYCLYCCDFYGSSYAPLQPYDKNGSVFYVNHGTLPSHIRSIKMTKQASLHVLVQRHDDVIRKRRTAIVLIFLMSLVALFVGLTILKTQKGKEKRQNLIEWNRIKTSELSKNMTYSEDLRLLREALLAKRRNAQHSIQVKTKSKSSNTRMYCHDVCHQYSAFRFRSSCQHHICKCKGQGYQHDSCLPTVRGCVIQQGHNSLSLHLAMAKFQQKEQSIFSCINYNTLGSEVHVLSNYGNTHKGKTEVYITENRTNSSAITIVLANYQNVKWNLRLQNSVKIKKVYLVSNKNLRRSRVTIQEEGKTLPKTDIVKIFSHVGYGEDRFGGHTRELLETIYNRIGDVTSFSGTSNANYWRINLEDNGPTI